MNRPEIAQITVIRYTNHVTGDHARVTQDQLWFAAEEVARSYDYE